MAAKVHVRKIHITFEKRDGCKSPIETIIEPLKKRTATTVFYLLLLLLLLLF